LVGKLDGKVVLITGAGSGIGRATALLFSEEGAKIVVSDVSKESGEESVHLVTKRGGVAIFVGTDVTKSRDVKAMVEKSIRTFGKIDVLYNNAGISPSGKITDISEKDWDSVMNINLKGVFLCSKYVVPNMLRAGGGVIVNTASAFGLNAFPGKAAYCASKAGVVLLTKEMALDYAPKIRVNCICPGAVHTPMYNRILATLKDPEQAKKEELKWYPLGRVAEPEEIAKAALYLASEDSSYVTGIALTVDGGWTSSLPK
jgi:NAD(P)-dependent dehydrogenase (short-subunit alcohol dehydrogenase family)